MASGAGDFAMNACNGEQLGHCQPYGTCQLETPGPWLSPGWCQCDPGRSGKHCRIASEPGEPPQDFVPVNVTVLLTRFGGFDTDDADFFTMDIRVGAEWVDKRFPMKDDVYLESVAQDLLDQTWEPWLRFSGTTDKIEDIELTAVTDNSTEISLHDEQEVRLSVWKTYTITQKVILDFRRFPFDSHKLEIQVNPALWLDVSYTHQPVVPDLALEVWNHQWPLTAEGAVIQVFRDADATPGDTLYSTLTVTVNVFRATQLAFVRLFVPSVILVIVSWAGFWIRPGALMPRFASGFISFLTLQSFRQMVLTLMPNGGNINALSWADIYVSAVGALLGLSVVQTVTAQFINERFSPQVVRIMDRVARWAFPLVYVTIVTIMLTLSEFDEQLVATNGVVHGLLVAFAVCYFGCIWYEIMHFPQLVFRRALGVCRTASSRYQGLELSATEIGWIFDALDSDRSGTIHHDELVKWLRKCHPGMRGRNEDAVRRVLDSVFDQEAVAFDEFAKKASGVLVKLALEIKPDLKMGDSVEEVLAHQLEMFTDYHKWHFPNLGASQASVHNHFHGAPIPPHEVDRIHSMHHPTRDVHDAEAQAVDGDLLES